MSAIANGPYNYYPPGVTLTGGTVAPILVQIENNWVYSLHFEYTYHLSKFEGHFVELAEQHHALPPTSDEKEPDDA